MKLLVITQMYPCLRHPTSAIFFANFISELSLLIDEIVVITPRLYIPKILTCFRKKLTRWHLDPLISNYGNIRIIRPVLPLFPNAYNYGINGIIIFLGLIPLIRSINNIRKIDLILGHNFLPEAISSTLIGRFFNIPAVSWAIGSDIHDFFKLSKVNKYLTKWTVKNSRLILSVSKELRNCILKIEREPKKIITFYRGINLNLFKIPLFVNKEDLNLIKDKRYILFVGRLQEDKGVFELAHSFIEISRRYSDLDLILIGEEIEKKKLESFFAENGVLNRIYFTGIIPHEKIAEYMKISELLVFPSWNEGLPNVIVEAMASGLPVISTEIGGMPEILMNEVSGLSIPVKDYQGLTQAILRFLDDKELKKKCIANAKKIVSERFNVASNAYKLKTLFSQIIDESNLKG